MSRLSRFIHFYTDEDEGNGGEKGVLKTVTGAIIHILDALKKPAHKFTATLEPIQDLHGQDAPYPAGGGINKFNEATVTFQKWTNSDGSVITGNAAKYGCVSQPITRNADAYSVKAYGVSPYSYSIIEYASDDTFIKRNHASASNSEIHVTLDQNTAYILVQVACIVESTLTADMLASYKVELSEGLTSPASYSPYSNICPITGHTGVNVVRTGKNILSNSTINKAGNEYRIGATLSSEYPFYLKSGTYTMSNSGTAAYCYYQKKGTSGNIIIHNATTTSGTFTLTEDGEYRFWFYTSIADPSFTDILLEVGSTASDYSPYTGATIPITFPDAAGTVYGCTLTNEGGEWKLRVTETAYTIPVNKIYLNVTWCYSDSVRTEFGYTTNFTIKKCNMLKPDRYTNLAGSTPIICTENGGYIYFGWDNMKAVFGNTQAEIREYLTNNPLVINFELATPIEYTLSESQALTLLKDTNNVWCDASDSLEMQYYAKAEETP